MAAGQNQREVHTTLQGHDKSQSSFTFCPLVGLPHYLGSNDTVDVPNWMVSY